MPAALPVAWGVGDGAGFDDIGFVPNSAVRFVYNVAITGSTAFEGAALGDTDGDGTYVLYNATQNSGATQLDDETGLVLLDPAADWAADITGTVATTD
jgi:hypothetical protein